MDVKTTFLNGNLSKDVYMTQPEGFTSKDGSKVCKLQKSIYGLKQASKSWNIRFDETIKESGFSQNQDEACVYEKVSGSAIVFLMLYVDDILLIGNDVLVLQSVHINYMLLIRILITIRCINKWGFGKWPINDIGYFFSLGNTFQVSKPIQGVCACQFVVIQNRL